MIGLIRPFFDRLDIEIPYIWYPIPLTAPAGPTTVFTDRWYDDREHWIPPGVGVVPRSQKPYFGPLPVPGIFPVQGTTQQWVDGFSYADYLAGKYPVGTRCVTIPWKITVVRIREAQSVLIPAPPVPLINQAQTVAAGLSASAQVEQAQTVAAGLSASAQVEQAQTVAAGLSASAQVEQAQTVDQALFADALVEQAHDVPNVQSAAALVEQAHTVSVGLSSPATVEQAQDVDAATPITPGATCLTAATIALNVTYSGTTSGTNTDWFVIPSWMTGSFELISNGGPASSPAFTVGWGICAFFVKTELNAIPCDQTTSASGGFGSIYVEVIGDGTNYSYTFRING